MNRRQAITAAIATGASFIGLPAQADETKLRVIYRYRYSPMGDYWDIVRMSELKAGDVWMFQKEPNVIEFETVTYIAKENPEFKNGVWGVIADRIDLAEHRKTLFNNRRNEWIEL